MPCCTATENMFRKYKLVKRLNILCVFSIQAYWKAKFKYTFLSYVALHKFYISNI